MPEYLPAVVAKIKINYLPIINNYVNHSDCVVSPVRVLFFILILYVIKCITQTLCLRHIIVNSTE